MYATCSWRRAIERACVIDTTYTLFMACTERACARGCSMQTACTAPLGHGREKVRRNRYVMSFEEAQKSKVNLLPASPGPQNVHFLMGKYYL